MEFLIKTLNPEKLHRKVVMVSSNDTTMQVIGCLVEALADDDGKIDIKCFEKVCNAGIKAAFVSYKVGDEVIGKLKEALCEVGCDFEMEL